MVVEVKTFVESGTLKICHECGETVLVGNETDACPLCGSKDMEVDDSFFENGKASRADLQEDWFYSSDVQPVSESMRAMRKNTFERHEDDAPKERVLAPIISMYPAM